MVCSIDKSLIDGRVLNIMSALERAGFEAYIAGPAVRDMLLGAVPSSFRIITTAGEADIRRLFRRCIDSGVSKGSVTVIESMTGYELICVPPQDGGERFSNLKKVLKLYECTVNALAYGTEEGVIDLFGGIQDIENRLIRGMGQETFAERPVLMLRLVRYAALLGFEIERQTAEEIKRSAAAVRGVSRAQEAEELSKILMSDFPERFGCLHELGLLRYIMPELDACFGERQCNKYHIYDVGGHTMKTVSGTPPDHVLRWAALLHDSGKPCCSSCDHEGIIHFYGHHRESVRIADRVLHRLHMDNALINDVLTLVEYHDIRIEPSYTPVKRMLSRLGAELFEKLLVLQRADSGAKNPEFLAEKLDKINKVSEIYRTVVREGQPYRISDLVINGRDLMKLKYRAGREIGDTLRTLLDEVLINPALNTRDYLLARAAELRNKKERGSKRRKDVRV